MKPRIGDWWRHWSLITTSRIAGEGNTAPALLISSSVCRPCAPCIVWLDALRLRSYRSHAREPNRPCHRRWRQRSRMHRPKPSSWRRHFGQRTCGTVVELLQADISKIWSLVARRELTGTLRSQSGHTRNSVGWRDTAAERVLCTCGKLGKPMALTSKSKRVVWLVCRRRFAGVWKGEAAVHRQSWPIGDAGSAPGRRGAVEERKVWAMSMKSISIYRNRRPKQARVDLMVEAGTLLMKGVEDGGKFCARGRKSTHTYRPGSHRPPG